MKGLNTGVVFALMVCVSAIMISLHLHKGHFWGDDFAAYIMQAQSVAEGTPEDFLEENQFTIYQSSFQMGPVAYPWGLPTIQAAVTAVFGTSLIAFKSVSAVSFLLFLLCLWFGFRKYHTRLGFLGLVGIFAFNPYVLDRTNAIGTELPFLYLSTQSMIMISILVVENRSITKSMTWDYVLLGASIAVAFFVRTNGLLLLVTLAISQCIAFLQKELKGQNLGLKSIASSVFLKTCFASHRFSFRAVSLSLTPYAVFFCAVVLWRLALPQGGASHLGLLNQITVSHLIEHAIYYLKSPADFFWNVPYHKWFYVMSFPILIFGVLKRLKVDYPIIVYALLTYLLYVVWPGTAGLRAIMPIIPFYISFIISGLEVFQASAHPDKRKLRKLACWVPFLAIVGIPFFVSINLVAINVRNNGESNHGPYAQTSKEMFSFIEENTDKDSIIIFFKPRVMIDDQPQIASYQ